jgi:hypothetical protein
MTKECITPLRRRMIEDMTVRHLASETQRNYIRAVKTLASFLGNWGRFPGDRRVVYVGAWRMRLARSGILGPGTPRRSPMKS